MKRRVVTCALLLWALTQVGCPQKIHSVSMHWADEGAEVYNIYRGTTINNRLFLAATVATAYTDYMVQGGTVYYYDVRGMNVAGESDPSNIAVAVVPGD